MTTAEKKKVGGRRAGSGRKPLPSGRVTVVLKVDGVPRTSVSITQDNWDAIQRWRKDRKLESNSEAVRQVIEHASAKSMPTDIEKLQSQLLKLTRERDECKAQVASVKEMQKGLAKALR